MMNLRQSICCLALLAAGVACKKKDAPQDEAASSTAAAAALAANELGAKQLGGKQQSQARAHLPEGCDLVATIDWQRLRAMKTMKADIEAGVADLMDPNGKDAAKKVAEFLQKADIDPLKDPGDIAVCLWRLEQLEQNGTPGFVAIVGGNFRPGAAIDALDTVSERIGSVVRQVAALAADQPSQEPERLEIGGVKALLDKESGVLVAQAKNGAFVVGNDRERFEKALTPGAAHTAYRLSPEPAGMALTKSAGPLFARSAAGSPFAAAAASFEGGHMGFDDATLRLQAHFGEPTHAALLEQGIKSLLASAPPGTAEGAKIEVKDKVVSVELPLPEEAMGNLLPLPGTVAPRPTFPPRAPTTPTTP